MCPVRLDRMLALARGALLAIAACVPLDVCALPYAFDLIARTGNSFLFFPDPPALSNNGIVAFRATLPGGTEGIFTGSGGALTTIAESSGPLRGFNGNMAVNTSGTVAFRGQLDTGNTGIFIGNGGPVTPLATDSGGRLASFSTPTINDLGAVVFTAALPGTGGNRLFLSQGGTLITLYDTSGPFSGFLGTPFINNRGQVAFIAGLDTGGTGLFIGDGTTTIRVADTTGAFSGFGTSPSLSDNGVAAFRAFLDADPGADALFTGNGIQLDEFVSTTADARLRSFVDPSINILGNLAFAAATNCFGGEVIAGTDPATDLVVAAGGSRPLCPPTTVLFGDVAVGVHWLHGFNNVGQLAGNADLAHGGRVLWRANPPGPTSGAALPVPGTLALLLMALAMWRCVTPAPTLTARPRSPAPGLCVAPRRAPAPESCG